VFGAASQNGFNSLFGVLNPIRLTPLDLAPLDDGSGAAYILNTDIRCELCALMARWGAACQAALLMALGDDSMLLQCMMVEA
jgi:hypothetical protein